MKLVSGLICHGPTVFLPDVSPITAASIFKSIVVAKRAFSSASSALRPARNLRIGTTLSLELYCQGRVWLLRLLWPIYDILQWKNLLWGYSLTDSAAWCIKHKIKLRYLSFKSEEWTIGSTGNSTLGCTAIVKRSSVLLFIAYSTQFWPLGKHVFFLNLNSWTEYYLQPECEPRFQNDVAIIEQVDRHLSSFAFWMAKLNRHKQV